MNKTERSALACRLVHVRNPWGAGREWQGRFSDGDAAWDEVSGALESTGFERLPGPPKEPKIMDLVLPILSIWDIYYRAIILGSFGGPGAYHPIPRKPERRQQPPPNWPRPWHEVSVKDKEHLDADRPMGKKILGGSDEVQIQRRWDD